MDQTIVAQYSLIAAALIAAVAALAAAFSDSKAACKALEGMTLHQHARSYRPYRIYSDYRYRYRSRTRIR